MDLLLVVKAAVALGVIGLIASALLAAASRRFHVETDPRVEQVLSVLPGANCGACGNPSCFSAAEALVEGTMEVTGCTAGGQLVADAVADVLGVEKCEVAAIVSLRHCGAGSSAKRRYEYSGILSCAAVSRLAGGDLECPAGCFGYGDCVSACPFDAISLDARGLPVIDLDRCTGCEACVKVCPRGHIGLLEMVSETAPIAVRCNSHDRPKMRKAYCPVCCIACKKCEKACPSDAIHVIDLLAVVDYERCTGCRACVAVCPQQCIDLHGRALAEPSHALDGLGAQAPDFELAKHAGAEGGDRP